MSAALVMARIFCGPFRNLSAACAGAIINRGGKAGQLRLSGTEKRKSRAAKQKEKEKKSKTSLASLPENVKISCFPESRPHLMTCAVRPAGRKSSGQRARPRERERDARELLWQYSNNLTSGGRGGAYIKRKKKKPAAAAVPVHRRPFFFLSRRNKYRRRRFRGFRLLSNGRVFAPRADGYYYYIPDPLAVFSPP